MSDTAIETEGLTKVYGKLRAVDGLALRVPQGAVYGFLGRNGAGKTTTMRVLLGLARATSGAARVLGHEVGREQIAILERTAFVSERKALYDYLTPAEIARFTSGFYPRWSHAAVERYARPLEIPMRQKYGKLSHGNQTKVCMLLALAQNADLLILDEPTLGLDPVVTDDILRALVAEHVAEGRTVFFSTHQLAEVEQIADWVGIIEEGRLLLEARLEDIKTEYRVVVAGGNGLPRATSGPVVSVVRAGGFTRYVVSKDAEAFAAGLQQQGAQSVEVFPLNLREFFLELVRKQDPLATATASPAPTGPGA
jgi:ABC-2 type transport system ATP-binding protein